MVFQKYIKSFLILLVNYNIMATVEPLFLTKDKIYIYDKCNISSNYLKNIFDKYKIKYEFVDQIDQDNESLHIIFNSIFLPLELFPKNYIAFQNIDLTLIELTPDYKKKLSSAIAVWDSSWSNIEMYSSDLQHYAYLPKNYEYTDPIILPCLLPVNSLKSYKEVLRYSNIKNSDISSHLPALFAICILQNPNLIIELGVRTGESTIIFNEALRYCNFTKMIGVDIADESSPVYKNIQNSAFYCMDDVKFPELWLNENPTVKADIIFVDTSHLYDHTLEEISKFLPLLSNNGMFLFHDSNMSPGFRYHRLNNIDQIGGWDNQKGVYRAICDYFSISFDESKYMHFDFVKDNIKWKLVHYPFCNGLTIIKKV